MKELSSLSYDPSRAGSCPKSASPCRRTYSLRSLGGLRKGCVGSVFEYVHRQSLNYDQLALLFRRYRGQGATEELRETRKSQLHIDVVEFFLSGLGEKALLRNTRRLTLGQT